MAKTNNAEESTRFIISNHELTGKQYDVVTAFQVHRLNYNMQVGSTFRQCRDGLYAAYDEKGGKLFFRFAEQLINDKSVLPNLKMKEDEQKS